MTHDTDKPADRGNDRATDPGHSDMVDRALLDVLVCPITRGPLDYDQANNELISRQAQKAFPVKNGVPIMLIEEARDLGGDGDAT